MRVSGALVALALFAGPGPGVAVEAAPRPPTPVDPVAVGRARAEQGRAAYAAGDYAAAARLFEAADALDPRPAYRYSVAIAREQAGELLEARRVLRDLPAYAPAVEALARVEARLLDERPPVRVLGVPDGAEVTLDGRPVGERTPIGEYTLAVDHPSIHPHRSRVRVVGGAPVELRPALAPRRSHGALRLTVGAEGWRLAVGAVAVDGPGTSEVVLPAGEHRVRVIGPDVDGARVVHVAPDARSMVEAPTPAEGPGAVVGGALVGGGAVAAAGIGLLIYSRLLDGEAADTLACARRPDGACTLADVRADEDDAFAAEAGGWIALGVGGLALAVAATVWATDDALPIRVGPAGVSGTF